MKSIPQINQEKDTSLLISAFAKLIGLPANCALQAVKEDIPEDTKQVTDNFIELLPRFIQK
ncbi:hypothetical protein PT285_04995 [Lactobacillus sp. ESL0791]|uniref:hypothetical protein n=1 Tax=Lactobacillus sp. ESL0791 TaxID=2983234 RepID=UPI0023F91EAC|nr:hypothetical protein [Lactobacillus sp. ESL0791]MDF7638753.1 hypothetical protein [Lactobacillus sp. ESL0791]